MTEQNPDHTIEFMELPTGEKLLFGTGSVRGLLVELAGATRTVTRCIEIGGAAHAIVIPLSEAVVDSLAADLRETLGDDHTVRIRPMFEEI
jgi:hypothetical protein